MPSARPILYSGPMVRALLARHKTQTRRLVKPQPRRWSDEHERQWHAHAINDGRTPEWTWWEGPPHGPSMYHSVVCPYGVPGDLLWVRETCTWDVEARIWRYAADGASVEAATGYRIETPSPNRWPLLTVPSIHLPRAASRLTSKLTEIRVQRLQDISEADAKAEGAERLAMDDDGNFYQIADKGTYRTGYAGLWNHINGERDGADWDSNPWIWAITFEVHKANVDTVLAQMEAA